MATALRASLAPRAAAQKRSHAKMHDILSELEEAERRAAGGENSGGHAAQAASSSTGKEKRTYVKHTDKMSLHACLR